ncbi:MAG TPA: nitronate monooxygenase, partial [Gemmatimonadaceae bacterium]|nr:nitronate monooxygenase [Gemmatimonadaceae bacterium]
MTNTSTTIPTLPRVIQGGMGAGVSNWRLARAVSQRGQLGVVSGTVIDTIFVRRLQDGDPGGHLRRAMQHFPCPPVVEAALARYFKPAGRAPGAPYKALPMYKQVVSAARQQLTMLAGFVEVWLAKEGHRGVVGINYLEKVQMATPAAALGAVLAGVDYVLMGAGVPREIPRLLDDLCAWRRAGVGVQVQGAQEPHRVEVDPGDLLAGPRPVLTRPRFLA